MKKASRLRKWFGQVRFWDALTAFSDGLLWKMRQILGPWYRRLQLQRPRAKKHDYRPAMEGLEARVMPFANGIAFSSSAYTIDEDGGNAVISVYGMDLQFQTTVVYTISDGTTTAGSDYDNTTMSGTLTFAPGSSTLTFSIPIFDEAPSPPLDEPDETINLTLSNPSPSVQLYSSPATLTILDDDDPPALSVANLSFTEGNSPTTGFLTFTATLSAVSAQSVTVEYTTADNSALDSLDYTSVAGTLSFAPGDPYKYIVIPILGDDLDEDNETFYVNFSNLANATMTSTQATATITDNDATPTLSIDDVTVTTEGNSGSVDYTFTVTLSEPSGRVVTVNYASADTTAAAGQDYGAVSDTLTFGLGETEKIIVVSVSGDTLDEYNETFTVDLSDAGNANITDGEGIGTINDDDAAPSVTSINPSSGSEASDHVGFTFVLSAVSGKTITISYYTVNGTAVAPGDYTSIPSSTPQTLTFLPGEDAKPLSLYLVNDDLLDEEDEEFYLALSGNNVTVQSQTTHTIFDNDDPVTISITDVTVSEGTGNTATFTVSLSAASGKTITVGWTTTDITAIAGSTGDYTSTSGTLTFAPSTTTQTIGIPILHDLLDEDDETFALTGCPA